MKELSEKQWTDYKGRYGTSYCSFCKHQSLNFSDPKFVSVSGIDVAIITCTECGHIEFFDIAEVSRIADKIDKEYREKDWR